MGRDSVRLRHFTITLKLLVGASLVYLLVRNASLADVWELLSGARPHLVLLSLLSFAAAVTLNALRWRIVLGLMGSPVPVRVAVVGTLEGMFFNLFLPTGIGGDVARTYRAYDFGLDTRRAVEGTLADRALGLWGLAVAVAVASLFSPGLWSIAGWQWLLGAAALVIAGGLAVGHGAAFLPVRAQNRWLDAAMRLVAAYSQIVRSRRFCTHIVPVLLLANLCIGVSATLAARSIGLVAPLADMTIVVEGGSLAALVPVSIGGWGVREGAVALLMMGMGHSRSAALALSALMGAVLATIGLAGAAIWMASPYKRSIGLARLRGAKAQRTVGRHDQ